ncbi:acid-sensing ion channel 1-like [Acanthaster planci]|uniref:Acid-sensing ion channel 1-like n=1 Tax=Acanthaster planci TaxID=133434 RepID=A0A8B7Y3B0_ACAPL|nr:acid-sensing ion channel 1-like [Acanthaster planci]XP_022086805.1 acid-sensing ion channel 1-like [Acanthaster planci]XP_022086806.1 acid-sensing ion channel 1-like [Acanthaster planci]
MVREDADQSPRPSLEREFAESTSLHGIAKVFHASRLLVRVFWVIIMLTCLCVCVWQISDRFHRFLQYKANTEISVEYVGHLPFPAVTICNFNRYRSGALAPGDEDALAYIWELSNYQNDYDYEGESNSTDSSYLDSLVDFNYTEFTLRAGFRMDNVTLLACSWRGKRNSCSAEDFSHVFTSYGNCWTFNSGKTGPVLTESYSGSGNGVSLLVDIQQSEYTETETIEAGLKIQVHDQVTPPTVESSGLALSPGVHAFMAVRRQQYLNLEHPYGKCDASRTLKRYDNYTLEGCNIECRANAVWEKCRCRLIQHPGNEVECTPEEVRFCAREAIDGLIRGDTESCDCPVPCNFTAFTTSLSTAFLPNEKILPILLLLLNNISTSDERNVSRSISEQQEYIRKNWVAIDIFYEDINYQKFEQTEAITPSALISDIGGQLGLFLGASFITLAEIFSYLSRKIQRLIHGPTRRPQKQRQMSHSVETLA